MSPEALDQVFTFWTPLPGRTIFEGVFELPPGHYLVASQGHIRMERYWDVPIGRRDEQSDEPAEAIAEAIRDLLLDAIRIRLRADVPVGCYLSGGLDSSGIAALTARYFNADLRTFGIRFGQQAFDEGVHQQRMAEFLGTHHREVQATDAEIGRRFAAMLWHAEKPLLRTAPVPLFMLSKAVRDDGLKVVLTGEGADEVFGGYNIFKEAKVRRFWSRQPDSTARAALTGRLYGYVFRDPRTKHFLKSFFANGLDGGDDPFFSHRLRWNNTSRIKAFFSDELKAVLGERDASEQMRDDLPEGYDRLDTVAKAQYIEMKLFLSNYLLSSQGDRVAMAHSVEIRVPFLDYRVIEFMARVPSRWKLLGLNEKYILKKALAPVLPDSVCQRRKQPYRAPIVHGLLSDDCLEDVMERLSPMAIASAGLFAPERVARLMRKVQTIPNPGEVDSMALAGILSSQIIHHQFVETFSLKSIPVVEPDVIIDKRSKARQGISALGSHQPARRSHPPNHCVNSISIPCLGHGGRSVMELNPVLLHEWLSRSAERLPAKDALVCGQDRWSYRKLDDYSNAFAAALMDLGIRRHDRVAVLLGNCAETVVSAFGATKAGAAFVLLESNSKARRLRHVLNDSGARVLVARANQAHMLAEALRDWDTDLKIIWLDSSPAVRLAGGISDIRWDTLFAEISDAENERGDRERDCLARSIDLDLAAIIYTSATTGKAKGGDVYPPEHDRGRQEYHCVYREFTRRCHPGRAAAVVWLRALPGACLVYGWRHGCPGAVVSLSPRYPEPSRRGEGYGISPGAQHGGDDAAHGQHRGIRFQLAALHDQCRVRTAGGTSPPPAWSGASGHDFQHVWSDRMCAGLLPVGGRVG